MSTENARTEQGRRPELEAIEVNPPIGYIGLKLLPAWHVTAKAGTYYYQTVVSDSAAQTSRTPGAAPTATTLSENSSTFSCAERIKRYVVPYEMVPLVGGVAGSDKLGAKAAKRSVQRSLESAILAALVDSAGTDYSDAIIDGLIAAANSVKRYAGKTVFACCLGTYRWLLQQDEIKNMLLRTFNVQVPEAQLSSILSIRPDVFKAALQGIFMFDDVLIADDDHWPAAYTYTAIVAKVPADGEELSFVNQPELGRTCIYLPESGNEFEIYSHPDDNIRGNVYDAVIWDSIQVMNSDAVVEILLGNANTTTTTSSSGGS
jgi:hypothetical protein